MSTCSKREILDLSIPKVSVLLVSSFFFNGCATALKPCSMAGNFNGLPEIVGDMECHQKKTLDGTWVNHGKYVLRYLNGKVAVTGEFNEGRKDGIWTFYNEDSIRILERVYSGDTEKSSQTFGYSILGLIKPATGPKKP